MDQSLGKPCEFYLHGAQGRAFVAKTVKKYGLPWGQPTGSPEAAAQLLTEGAQLLNLGGDFSLCPGSTRAFIRP